MIELESCISIKHTESEKTEKIHLPLFSGTKIDAKPLRIPRPENKDPNTNETIPGESEL